MSVEVVDGFIQVTEEDATNAAVAQKLPGMAEGSRVLAFCYDTGARYLSVEGLFS